MSVRLSATDWIPGGITGEDAVEIARAFKAHGCDLIDVSTGQTDPQSRPVYGRMYQATSPSRSATTSASRRWRSARSPPPTR